MTHESEFEEISEEDAEFCKAIFKELNINPLKYERMWEQSVKAMSPEKRKQFNKNLEEYLAWVKRMEAS